MLIGKILTKRNGHGISVPGVRSSNFSPVGASQTVTPLIQLPLRTHKTLPHDSAADCTDADSSDPKEEKSAGLRSRGNGYLGSLHLDAAHAGGSIRAAEQGDRQN